VGGKAMKKLAIGLGVFIFLSLAPAKAIDFVVEEINRSSVFEQLPDRLVEFGTVSVIIDNSKLELTWVGLPEPLPQYFVITIEDMRGSMGNGLFHAVALAKAFDDIEKTLIHFQLGPRIARTDNCFLRYRDKNGNPGCFARGAEFQERLFPTSSPTEDGVNPFDRIRYQIIKDVEGYMFRVTNLDTQIIEIETGYLPVAESFRPGNPEYALIGIDRNREAPVESEYYSWFRIENLNADPIEVIEHLQRQVNELSLDEVIDPVNGFLLVEKLNYAKKWMIRNNLKYGRIFIEEFINLFKYFNKKFKVANPQVDKLLELADELRLELKSKSR
jgi:hypothetical protein